MTLQKKDIQILKPDVGEEEARAVYDVIMSGQLCEGNAVRKFEESFASFIGIRNAIACFNGTVALHLLWRSIGLKEGDEVIVPSLTFISTAVSLLYVGAKPVFAEVCEDSYNLDPEDVMKKITCKTKAIMPVHYAGQVGFVDEIDAISKKNGIMFYEDAAEAAGAFYKGRYAGSFARASIFSFTPSKNLTTGEGGMLVTDDDELAARVRLLKNHGIDREYHHIEAGYNYRITEMQAAMGIVQLKKLESTINIRKRNAEFYDRFFSNVEGVITPSIAEERNHTYMIYTIRLNSKKLKISRDEILGKLRERGIQAKIYFPPAHLQPVFVRNGWKKGDLPVTESISNSIISLPVHSRLSEEELNFVASSTRDIITCN